MEITTPHMMKVIHMGIMRITFFVSSTSAKLQNVHLFWGWTLMAALSRHLY